MMSDDRITIAGELRLPEGADIEAFKLGWEKLQQEHGELIYFEPDGHYDTDGKPVITAVSLVRRRSK
jgi:hypothetical protein